VGTGTFDIAVSVPLVLEYESVLVRHVSEMNLTLSDIDAVLDYMCLVAKKQSIFFLWRPLLKDPKDDMVAEIAVAAGCHAVVTHNRRHFAPLAALGPKILTPAQLLQQIGVSREHP